MTVAAAMLPQALAGEVGMSAELDEVAKSLYNGQLPSIWRALAPATLKGLGNWIIHFHRRNQQYLQWVSCVCCVAMCGGIYLCVQTPTYVNRVDKHTASTLYLTYECVCR